MKNYETKDRRTDILIRELAGAFIARISNRQSLITVTNVTLLQKGQRAVIRITVLPEERESDAMIFLQRHLGEMRDYISKNAKFAPLPHLDIEIDYGEKNRQRVDELLLKKDN